MIGEIDQRVDPDRIEAPCAYQNTEEYRVKLPGSLLEMSSLNRVCHHLEENPPSGGTKWTLRANLCGSDARMPDLLAPFFETDGTKRRREVGSAGLLTQMSPARSLAGDILTQMCEPSLNPTNCVDSR